MTNIETPEGWTPSGPCFTRVYGGKLAVLHPHPHRDRFRARVYEAGEYEVSTESALPLADAAAWANDQLGVPKPVEVHQRKFSDGWLLWSDETNRCGHVLRSSIGWFTSPQVGPEWPTEEAALESVRTYVRGDA